MIRVEPGELDVARFEVLLDGARAAARGGSWQRRRAAWRCGVAAAGRRSIPGAGAPPSAPAVQLRLQAAELRIDAELRLGRHDLVIAELERMTAVHPLREHLHALLMLALYRDGRQAEALAVYQRARRLLLDELGTEPGTECGRCTSTSWPLIRSRRDLRPGNRSRPRSGQRAPGRDQWCPGSCRALCRSSWAGTASWRS